MNEPTKQSPALALMLGFAPAVVGLTIIAMNGQNGPPPALLWATCIIGAVCCFTSSFMLFRRKTGWAIACGLMLLLFNGAISLFTGCMALLSGSQLFK